MDRQLIFTEDGSHSFFIPELEEQYHSIHGAIQESEHIFIQAGLSQCYHDNITIFEVGFGTGLNALLSFIFAIKNNRRIRYITVEKYPLNREEYESLNYSDILDPGTKGIFMEFHRCNWNEPVIINKNFTIHKIENDLRKVDFNSLPSFDLIFFDAFAPNKHSDLWIEEIYTAIFNQSTKGAIMVTYCSKGIVRCGFRKAGFFIERIPGPPGKKEMLRAIK